MNWPWGGILHIRNGIISDVSRTLISDICNICGCKPVAFKFLFQKKLFFNRLPNLKIAWYFNTNSNLNLFIRHFNRLKGKLGILYGFLMRNPSLRETTPLGAVTQDKVASGSNWRLIKTFPVDENYHHTIAKKKRVVFILILQKINPHTLDG